MMEVGIVGIGNMGLGMALRLLDRGYAVGVRDLVAEREHARTGCMAPRSWPTRRRRRRAVSC